MKNSNDTSWDQTSDLPICSTGTLTTVLPRCSLYVYNTENRVCLSVRISQAPQHFDGFP